MQKENYIQKTINNTSVLLAILLLLIFGQKNSYAQSGNSTLPVYNVGLDSLHKFIKGNITIPETVKNGKVSGVVTVSYVVNKEGSVENIKLVRGIDHECDLEAIRVTKLLKGWIPALHFGKPVDARLLMQIEFKSGSEKCIEQSYLVTGKVLDKSNGKAVEGALVVISGTNMGTLTDGDGNYTLEVKDKETSLEITSIGYEATKVETGNNNKINIELTPAYYIIDFKLNQIKQHD